MREHQVRCIPVYT